MSSELGCIQAALWSHPMRHPDLRSTSLALSEIPIPTVMSKMKYFLCISGSETTSICGCWWLQSRQSVLGVGSVEREEWGFANCFPRSISGGLRTSPGVIPDGVFPSDLWAYTHHSIQKTYSNPFYFHQDHHPQEKMWGHKCLGSCPDLWNAHGRLWCLRSVLCNFPRARRQIGGG